MTRLLQSTHPSAKVTWVNEEEEQGLPYDILVAEEPRLGQDANKEPLYVEVKSSTSLSKPLFEISLRELEFARRQGAAYSLYRVLGACGPAPQVIKLHDPSRGLTLNNLALYLGSPVS